MLLWPHLSHVCWCPWAPLRKFSLSVIYFGRTWGIWKLFCALAWAEACSGSQQSLLCQGVTWRGRRWDRLPVWVPWVSLDILHISARGKGFLQLIHAQKCWDEKRDQILFPLQGHSIWPHRQERGGTGKGPWSCPIPGGLSHEFCRLLPFATAKEPLTPWCCSSRDADQILSIH